MSNITVASYKHKQRPGRGGGGWDRQMERAKQNKKEFKTAKSWDRVESKQTAAQPTQSKLSPTLRLAIKQIPMWCSRTQRITTVYLRYQELHLDGTEEGKLIHPDMQQQWMFPLRKLQPCFSLKHFVWFSVWGDKYDRAHGNTGVIAGPADFTKYNATQIWAGWCYRCSKWDHHSSPYFPFKQS